MAVTVAKLDPNAVRLGACQVEQQFPDDIEHIRFSIGEDWAHDAAIFFRVLLKDQPDPQDRLRNPVRRQEVLSLSSEIMKSLREKVPDEDFEVYFAFRTVREQESLHDPDWN